MRSCCCSIRNYLTVKKHENSQDAHNQEDNRKSEDHLDQEDNHEETISEDDPGAKL